ncbi:MAG: galactokinase [Candidatus Omnitrophica bacterium]|nr:galactokinase [Candidatus Omnitrophota bacterium]
MIITRTPFRITLGGGGTDLSAYYSRHGGFIFAAAISRYMYVYVNRPVVDDLIRVKYSKTEVVTRRDEVQHEIVREAMRRMDVENAIEIISMADVPAGTGLGSSSCYTVGLLNALHHLKRDYIALNVLAEEASDLEINGLGKPIGKQDQYMAAFGGLTILEISREGKVSVRKVNAAESVINDLNRNLLMFYTGVQRNANDILSSQSKVLSEEGSRALESMHYIKEIGYKILAAVESGNITDVGLLFDQHWAYKKKMNPLTTNPRFDEIYSLARGCGALGGKISGAGGGGFFLFYVEKDHEKFRTEMAKIGLREMKYGFDFEGSRLLLNI